MASSRLASPPPICLVRNEVLRRKATTINQKDRTDKFWTRNEERIFRELNSYTETRVEVKTASNQILLVNE